MVVCTGRRWLETNYRWLSMRVNKMEGRCALLVFGQKCASCVLFVSFAGAVPMREGQATSRLGFLLFQRELQRFVG